MQHSFYGRGLGCESRILQLMFKRRVCGFIADHCTSFKRVLRLPSWCVRNPGKAFLDQIRMLNGVQTSVG